MQIKDISLGGMDVKKYQTFYSLINKAKKNI